MMKKEKKNKTTFQTYNFSDKNVSKGMGTNE